MSLLRHNARTRVFLLSLLFVAALTLAAFTRSREPLNRLTLRLAGDGWFLKSLITTGLIAGYKNKAGVHIEMVDETIARS